MEKRRFIPLSVPDITGNEWKYVKQCLDTGWISSAGAFVDQFEKMVADYVGAAHGVSVVNGTAALHIALMLAGVGAGEYVLIPNITFVASANAVAYLGAEPILVDVEPGSWQMDLGLVEAFLEENAELNDAGHCVLKSSGRRVGAIMPVHVLGGMCDMDRLLRLAQRFRLCIVEDAAESLGSRYQGKHAGTFGLFGCFSFNGNKIISTGGGGVIVTDDPQLAAKAKHITTTAKANPDEYYHDEVGYNYRLVNVLAAIGVAQMEDLPTKLQKKEAVSAYYRESLSGVSDIRFQAYSPQVRPNHWLLTIETSHQKKLLAELNNDNIISRPFWVPMNRLPMYQGCAYVNDSDVSSALYDNCLSIPCSVGISIEEMDIVVAAIKRCVG